MRWYKGLSVLISALLLLLLSLPSMAAPAAQRIDFFANDPEDSPNYVVYYKGRTQSDAEDFVWSRDELGRPIVELDGKNQYFRLTNAKSSPVDAFTFSTWVYWKGHRDPQKPTEQILFSFYRNENYYLTASLYMKNAQQGVDGLYVTISQPDKDPVSLFMPLRDNTSVAFPENEWHHVAVTATDSALTVYIDGTRYLHTDPQTDLSAMDLRTFRMGADFGTTGPYLNANLRSTALYTAPLTDEQVYMLSKDLDPLNDTATTPTTGTLATRPVTAPQHTPHDTQETPGLVIAGRMWGLIALLISIVVFVAVMSVIFSVQNSRRARNGGGNA